jgi:hypothetical protein
MAQCDPQVTFFTASMGTKWTAYSQALLETKFPAAKRVLIDGSRDWDPLCFVQVCEEARTAYTVLVDEDCFILDSAQLDSMIDFMNENQDVSLLGTPDGGTFHRHYNPFACNTLFLIVRNSLVRGVRAEPNWRALTFRDLMPPIDTAHLAQLDSSRVNTNLQEPYYPFFWWVRKSGGKTCFVMPSVGADTLGSVIYWRNAPRPLLIHMWWLRQWFVTDVEPYLGVSNRSRYDALEKNWLRHEFKSASSMRALLKWRLRMFTRRLRFRVSRLTVAFGKWARRKGTHHV